MDKLMPGMDGIETTKAIRKIEKNLNRGQKCYIAAATASVYPGSKDECIAAGMDEYLAKPFQLHELAALIENVRNRS